MRAAVWSSVEGLPECLRLFGSSVMSALLRKSAAQTATQTGAVLVPSSCQLFSRHANCSGLVQPGLEALTYSDINLSSRTSLLPR